MTLIFICIAGILGAVLTFFISAQYKQIAVGSSALLSLLVGLFFYWFPDLLNAYLTKTIPVVFFGTSFIGMVSSKVCSSYIQLVVAGILFSLIYSIKSQFFEGFGGALGALAFIALLLTMIIFGLFKSRINFKEALVKVQKWIFNQHR
ncbi:hypothetical protein [Gelidibacter salicanalis]|uniref:Uncharacterized protein n=1 Tax=Gelidibacter salicanalis TaxID=291193 RepID=A0A934KVE6_9FLAO|nr:hypothetical protein [Gelidibacter salicanalis]MBJ7881352.1 hypothetical protein [Gelidibacter salicanalis]